MATVAKKLSFVTSADANAVELDLNGNPINVPMDVYITMKSDNAGTVQFLVFKAGQVPVAGDWTGQRAFVGGEVVPPFTIQNGYYNLFYKASGASQIFTIGY